MAHMNGFTKHGLDDDAFSEKSTLSGLRTFDAFPKTRPSYTSASRRGGQWTILIFIICSILTFSELRVWWAGVETHHFSVERGVSHELQMNLDLVVAMSCHDLHINVQDAAGDRILAGELLTKDETNWQLWTNKLNKRRRGNQQPYRPLHEDNPERTEAEAEDQHVGHVLGHMREGGKKFPKSPKLRQGESQDSCRIFGSLEGNKVQGDFHITARGHGYVEFGGHLDHTSFNFSHYITELSFGPHYPSLLNPLDKTISTTPSHFHKFQYYLSIVPTIFTQRRVSTKSGSLDPAAIPQPPTLDLMPVKDKDGKEVSHIVNKLNRADSKTLFTNQYAATSQSHPVSENTIPGIFFKYDIEPILLIVAEQRSSFLVLMVRIVNVVSGVLVGGGWMFQLSGWIGEMVSRKDRRSSAGVLHGRHATVEDDHGD